MCWNVTGKCCVTLGPDLQNILRLSYYNAKVTINLRLTTNLQNILQWMESFSRVRFTCKIVISLEIVFSALTLLVGRQEEHPGCKKLEWWVAGVVICLEQGADLHMAQLMPLTVSCFSKIQIGFTFLVLAHPGSPEKGPLNRCVYSVRKLSYDIPERNFSMF